MKKELYDIVEGFWHRGVFAAKGFKIALTNAEAKNLLTGGNVRRIAANDAASPIDPIDPIDPAPAAAVEVAAPVQIKSAKRA